MRCGGRTNLSAVVIVVLILAGLWVALSLAYGLFQVPSTAMEPTILKDESILVSKLAFRNKPPGRGDVVVYRRDDTWFVKRVIAVAGDTIEIRHKDVFVNQRSIAEPHVRHRSDIPPSKGFEFMDDLAAMTVPAGSFFLMGDNRDISLDSRSPDVGCFTATRLSARSKRLFDRLQAAEARK